MQPSCAERVTIVVLTYNRRAELARSLEHLLALPERPSIVVVDNGGTDDTAAFMSARHPHIPLVRTGANLGAAGRNHGVRQVRTPYVAFSDDDTWWAPGALSLAADLFDRHPRIAVLNAGIVVGPEERPDPACMAMEASPLETVPGVGPLLTGFMAGANVMRTQAFRKAGGYWPPLFIGGEEALLAMDILDAGGHIVYAPALRVHHWPSTVRDNPLRKRMIARNAIWTACLRLPWPVALQHSLRTLRALPDVNLRRGILNETLLNLGTLLPARRVLRRETRALLDEVWRHEQAGSHNEAAGRADPRQGGPS